MVQKVQSLRLVQYFHHPEYMWEKPLAQEQEEEDIDWEDVEVHDITIVKTEEQAAQDNNLREAVRRGNAEMRRQMRKQEKTYDF